MALRSAPRYVEKKKQPDRNLFFMLFFFHVQNSGFSAKNTVSSKKKKILSAQKKKKINRRFFLFVAREFNCKYRHVTKFARKMQILRHASIRKYCFCRLSLQQNSLALRALGFAPA